MGVGGFDLYGDATNFLGPGVIDAPNLTVPDVGSFVPPALSIPDAATSVADVPKPSGLSDFASKLGGGIEKSFETDPLGSLVKSLGIGATGLNFANQFKVGSQLNNAQKTQQQAQSQATAAAAPAVAFGTQTLQDAQGGKLPGPIQAGVDQWVQQAKADMKAKYEAMGLGNSSDLQGEFDKIDLQAKAMVGTLLQGQEQTALTGLQTGVSAATGGAAVAQQQEALLANLIASANQQLGRLGAAAA